MPAGTRTAPTVGALTVTENHVSVGVVDASGDSYSEGIKAVGGGLTDMAEIEALVAAYQPNTQGSVWRVEQTVVWEGQKDPDMAVAGFRGSTANGINMLFKNPAELNAVFTGRVVAPIETIMQGNQDIPLLVAPLPALVTAYLTLLGAGYNLDSMQFTGRKERRNNPRIAT